MLTSLARPGARLRLSRSSLEILSLIALASFSFSPTTLPHHYQESTAQKKQQSRGKPLVFLESDAVIEVGLLDAGFSHGCWGGKIQSSPLSCSDRSRLVLSRTR